MLGRLACYIAAVWDGFPPAAADSKSLYRAQAAAANATIRLGVGKVSGCWQGVLRQQWQ